MLKQPLHLILPPLRQMLQIRQRPRPPPLHRPPIPPMQLLAIPLVLPHLIHQPPLPIAIQATPRTPLQYPRHKRTILAIIRRRRIIIVIALIPIIPIHVVVIVARVKHLQDVPRVAVFLRKRLVVPREAGPESQLDFDFAEGFAVGV